MNWKVSKIEQLLVHVFPFPILLRHNFSHQRCLLSTFLSCESTDVFLTPHTFSSSRKALEDSPDENVPWHSLLLSVVLGFFSLLFYLFWPSPKLRHIPFTSWRGDRNLVFVVGLSHRAADVVPLASLNSPTSLSPPLLWVTGVTSNTKPTMLMRTCKWILKKITLNQMANRHTTHRNDLLSREKHFQKKTELPEKELHDAPCILHYNMRFNTKLCAHDLEWAQRGGDTLNYQTESRNQRQLQQRRDRFQTHPQSRPLLEMSYPLRPTNCHLASPWRKATPNTAPETQHKNDNIPKNTNTKYNK